MAYTADQLRQDPSLRANMKYNDLRAAGMSDLEARTVEKGFTGAFGGGAAKKWRESQTGYVDDATWLKNASNPTMVDYQKSQVINPTLPKGSTMIPTTMQAQQGEILDSNSYKVQSTQPINSINIPNAPTIQGTTAQTPTEVDPNAAVANLSPVGNVEFQKTQAIPDMVAAQGTVNAKATVQGQLADLYSQFDNGQPPAWAKGAMTKAEEVMAARGLGTSSLAGSAIAAAIQEQAINIAATDAATYFKMDLTNLDNEQTTRLTNFQAKQQNMLTDTSIANAEKQFNASSKMQVEQFTTQLVTQIKQQNQSLAANMEQFNAAQKNTIEAKNADNKIAVEKAQADMNFAIQNYNSQLEYNRSTFNANMAAQIDQSNAQWRRSINTANTAAINAATQTNVQNMFNLSNQALSNLWNAFRDEASWAFTANESQKTRDWNAMMAANGRNFITSQQSSGTDNLLKQLGNFLGSDAGSEALSTLRKFLPF